MQASPDKDFNKKIGQILYFPRATTAIYTALKSYCASGKIIIPSTICLDPIIACHYANYEPVFVGVEGFQLDLKKTISILDNDPKVNAILLPFLYGYPIVGLDEFWNQIKSREILVIEDLAQTLGPSHFIAPHAKAKVVTVYSCGRSKIIDTQRSGIAHTLDTELYSEMKNLHPKEFLISENAYGDLERRYRETYESFLSTDTFENNWKSFYRNVWNSDPRLFIPLLEKPIEYPLSLQAIGLQTPDYDLRKNRHRALDEVFRNLPNAVLPDVSDSTRPIWRTTVRIPNFERDQLYKYLKSRGLFASKWYKAMHRYVPDFMSQNSGELASAELFEDEVLNFRIDSHVDEAGFHTYKSAIEDWIFDPSVRGEE